VYASKEVSIRAPREGRDYHAPGFSGIVGHRFNPRAP